MKKFSLFPTFMFVFFVSMILLSPRSIDAAASLVAALGVFKYISGHRAAASWSQYVFNHALNKKFWWLHVSILIPLIASFILLLIGEFNAGYIPALLGTALFQIGVTLKEAKKDWLIY